MTYDHRRIFAFVAFGAAACSSSGSKNSETTGTGGCTGTQCTSSGGSTSLGSGGAISGSGGATASGGATTSDGGSSSTGGQSGGGCEQLSLTAGMTGPNGILALHDPGGAFGFPYGNEIATDGSFVYFTFNSEFTRVPIGGGAPQSIQPLKGSSSTFFVIGGNVVWIEQDPTSMAYGILKVPVSATDSTSPSSVASMIDEPDVVTSDATAIYFSNRDKKIVYRAPLDGSGVTQLATNAEPLGAVVANDTYYWIDFSNEVMSVPTSGGTPSSLAAVMFGGPMAAEGSALYWTDTSDEVVDRFTPGDKSPTVLATFGPLDGAGAIAVENGDVYFTPEGFGCGGVQRIPKDGSAVTLVVNGLDSPSDLALDAKNGYVVASNGVFQFAL